MLFFINSRISPGVTRNQVVEQFKTDIEQKTWELIKKGVVVHKFFKVGEQPGVIALLNCESLEEARALVNELRTVKNGMFEFDIDPVDHFPSFD
jgi:hypothetical protein